MPETPLTRSEILILSTKTSEFATLCIKEDSLGRFYVWNSLSLALLNTLKEEELHSFTYPSPHKPEISL
jgi:hypothetical protein